MNVLLLIILLSNGGYWFDGPGTITVNWAGPEGKMPASSLIWQLSFGAVELASGQTDIKQGDKGATIAINVPPTRTATEMTWRYQLKETSTGKLLEEGSRKIRVFPRTILKDAAKSVAGKKVIVVENDKGELAATLKEAGVEAVRVNAVGELQLRPADIVFVGENELGADASAQQVLFDKAMEGASVFVLAQSQPPRLGEWPLRNRMLSERKPLCWREGHPLFEGLDGKALEEWVREEVDGGWELKAVQLGAEAAVLELGYWPRETPGKNPVPIDALVVTQTLGKGRIVYWQAPMGKAKQDVRRQIILGNMLSYAITRPEATLPQGLREPAEPAGRKAGEKELTGAEK